MVMVVAMCRTGASDWSRCRSTRDALCCKGGREGRNGWVQGGDGCCDAQGRGVRLVKLQVNEGCPVLRWRRKGGNGRVRGALCGDS